MGRAARDLAQTNPGHMHRGHELWNISLKFACEADRTFIRSDLLDCHLAGAATRSVTP